MPGSVVIQALSGPVPPQCQAAKVASSASYGSIELHEGEDGNGSDDDGADGSDFNVVMKGMMEMKMVMMVIMMQSDLPMDQPLFSIY